MRFMRLKLPFRKDRKSVSVVRLSGVIANGPRAGISDQACAPLLEAAFRKGKPSAVALVINSPGGSPVQSSLIGSRIRRLAAEHDVPVYAFVEDVAASGGYWLACAADKIYLDESSIVGSIGVISASFGAHEFLNRQGFERRVYTAGKSKSMLDPFRPENPEDVERLKGSLEQIHEVFKTHVTSRRGGRLASDQDLFTGEIWLGQKAIDVGLADHIGHLVPTMKDMFGDKVKFRVFGQRRSIAQRFGLSLAQDAIALIEERTAYARFGL